MSAIDSPAVVAARLTGRRRAFLSFLSDADHQYVRAYRGEVFLTPAGLVDWSISPLPGDVTAYGHAEAALGGAA
ncbi:MAG TPA: hypothetical protein VKY79_06945 [Actinomycetaceae bacterium]|nr:hypothetical protein [Actinomycetaceae bacterium]